MATFPISTLKQRVNTYIKENRKQEITGPVLQSILHDIIDSINALFPPDPVKNSFNASNLDGTGSITITHNLGTLTPNVTLTAPDGTQMFETNVIIKTTSANAVKLTIISPEPTGNYNYEIK